ncbi:MAG: hypothetical protein Tsb007_39930 [Rhizobacter sp.]
MKAPFKLGSASPTMKRSSSQPSRSWTQAAHEAGFSDSAHLTRTFKRMFGLNPAALVQV